MTSALTRPVFEGFDPLSPEFIADPFPTLEQARHELPVFYYAPLNFWVVTRYLDVVEILADFKTFSSRSMGIVPPPEDLADEVPQNMFAESFICLDPPEHTLSRKNANKWFTRGHVAEAEDAISVVAQSLIDGFIDRGSCDLLNDYCYPLTLTTIIDILGLPREDAEHFRRWTEDLFSVMSPRAADSVSEQPSKPMPEEERRRRWMGIVEADQYYGGLIDDRRTNPQNDLISAMVHLTDASGEPALSKDRMNMHIHEMIAAGNDTTANLMAHMVQYLVTDPEALSAVRSDRAVMNNAIEEGLRWRGSAPGHFRLTTREVEISDVTVPAGSLLWLVYISASNDESHFPEPRTFDVHRANAKDHLAFGKGRHMCMGAPLARLMARVGLETLFERIPSLEVLEEQSLEYLPMLTVLTLKSMKVRWSR
jgi:cytochrome P450